MTPSSEPASVQPLRGSLLPRGGEDDDPRLSSPSPRDEGGTTGGYRPGRLGGWLTALASLVGLSSFLYPFIVPAIQRATTGQARAGEAPLVFAAVTMLCVLAIVADLDPMRSGANASKLVAMLAALVAIDAMLRLVPAFLGASPVFLLIMLGGYVYGPRFGFQLGALTLLVSAFVTGGIGPWLPYQMLGAGWVGLSAGWLPHPAARRRQLVILAVFGAVWGLLFGALLNVWFWPVAAPGGEVSAGLSWSPELSAGEALRRYGAFYATTSLWYDAFRAIGNVVLVVVLGGPILRTLERYRSRLTWEWRPA